MTAAGISDVDEWFSYDQDGQLTDMWEKTPHSTQYYHSVATFFGNGKVKTLQLASPSLYTMTWGLDGEGRWDTLTDTTTSQAIVIGPTNGGMYNAAGQPINAQLTGTTPDQDIYTYDANTGAMKTFEFEVGNSPSTKNMTGIDPAGLAAVDATNPQTWNRYAYVGNTPITAIDPLGLCIDNGNSPICSVFGESGVLGRRSVTDQVDAPRGAALRYVSIWLAGSRSCQRRSLAEEHVAGLQFRRSDSIPRPSQTVGRPREL